MLIVVLPRICYCQVKQVFNLKLGKGKYFIIAGCLVEKGAISRGKLSTEFHQEYFLITGNFLS
jgi:hypothetical protein